MFTGPTTLSPTRLFAGDSLRVSLGERDFLFEATTMIVIAGIFIDNEEITAFFTPEELVDAQAIWALDNGPDPGV